MDRGRPRPPTRTGVGGRARRKRRAPNDAPPSRTAIPPFDTARLTVGRVRRARAPAVHAARRGASNVGSRPRRRRRGRHRSSVRSRGAGLFEVRNCALAGFPRSPSPSPTESVSGPPSARPHRNPTDGDRASRAAMDRGRPRPPTRTDVGGRARREPRTTIDERRLPNDAPPSRTAIPPFNTARLTVGRVRRARAPAVHAVRGGASNVASWPRRRRRGRHRSSVRSRGAGLFEVRNCALAGFPRSPSPSTTESVSEPPSARPHRNPIDGDRASRAAMDRGRPRPPTRTDVGGRARREPRTTIDERRMPNTERRAPVAHRNPTVQHGATHGRSCAAGEDARGPCRAQRRVERRFGAEASTARSVPFVGPGPSAGFPTGRSSRANDRQRPPTESGEPTSAKPPEKTRSGGRRPRSSERR
jgi:hypothetical protein